MSAYDPTIPDAYTTHLSEVNVTNAVIATEDIFNNNGMLLVKKGFPIKPDIARKLLNHKLVKPLETSVNVDDSITGAQLYEHIQAMLRRFEDCRLIHQSLRLDSLLLALCQRYARHALLVQKVTVLSLRLKTEYDKALFCAWLVLPLAQRLGLSPSDTEAAFIAGLAHDTGMLHLNPELTTKTGEYSAEEWRAMQSHTLIADMFLSHIPELPELSRRAVREHHERCDGSGYPQGLFEDQLSLVGQMVAMADSLYAIRRKGIDGRTPGLGEMLPILRLNSQIHTYGVFAATVQLIQIAQLPGPQPVDEATLAPAADQLIRQRQRLEQQFSALCALAPLLSADISEKSMRIAGHMLVHTRNIALTSGFLSESLGRWFEFVRQERLTVAAREVAEIGLMYQEFDWQLKQLIRTLELLLTESANLPRATLQQVRQALSLCRPDSGQSLAVGQ